MESPFIGVKICEGCTACEPWRSNGVVCNGQGRVVRDLPLEEFVEMYKNWLLANQDNMRVVMYPETNEAIEAKR